MLPTIHSFRHSYFRLFIRLSFVQSLVFCVLLCRSLFLLLSFFFWPLHCLSFQYTPFITQILTERYQLHILNIILNCVWSLIRICLTSMELRVKIISGSRENILLYKHIIRLDLQFSMQRVVDHLFVFCPLYCLPFDIWLLFSPLVS